MRSLLLVDLKGRPCLSFKLYINPIKSVRGRGSFYSSFIKLELLSVNALNAINFSLLNWVVASLSFIRSIIVATPF